MSNQAEHIRVLRVHHKEKLFNILEQFALEDNFCDVTIHCGQDKIRAHGIILAAGSDFFKNCLSNTPSGQQPYIFVNNVDVADMREIMRFLYSGELNVPRSQLQCLIELAGTLGIYGLSRLNLREKVETKQSVKHNFPQALNLVFDENDTTNNINKDPNWYTTASLAGRNNISVPPIISHQSPNLLTLTPISSTSHLSDSVSSDSPSSHNSLAVAFLSKVPETEILPINEVIGKIDSLRKHSTNNIRGYFEKNDKLKNNSGVDCSQNFPSTPIGRSSFSRVPARISPRIWQKKNDDKYKWLNRQLNNAKERNVPPLPPGLLKQLEAVKEAEDKNKRKALKKAGKLIVKRGRGRPRKNPQTVVPVTQPKSSKVSSMPKRNRHPSSKRELRSHTPQSSMFSN